ncbi:hypothetical protein Bbelb_295530, partial [Branchiostoma belcheri]
TPGLGGPQLNRQPSWSSIIHTSPPASHRPQLHPGLPQPRNSPFSEAGVQRTRKLDSDEWGRENTVSHSHHYLAKKPSRWMGAVFAEVPLMGINPTREQPPVKAMPRRGGDLQCYRGKISRKSIVSLSSMDGVNLGLIYASCNQDLISDKPLSKLLGRCVVAPYWGRPRDHTDPCLTSTGTIISLTASPLTWVVTLSPIHSPVVTARVQIMSACHLCTTADSISMCGFNVRACCPRVRVDAIAVKCMVNSGLDVISTPRAIINTANTDQFSQACPI